MATSSKSSSYSSKRVIIVAHYLLYGAAHALKDFLLEQKKTSELLFITLPLVSQRTAAFAIFRNSKRIAEDKKNRGVSETTLEYGIDFFQTLWWVLSQKKIYDVYFGCGVLDAFVGVLLKKIGIVKKVIFYSIDFVPKRFGSELLNTIYHTLEKICLKNADEVWDLSPRMAPGREKFLAISAREYRHQVVPIGVWNKNITKIPFGKINRHQVLFIGHLLEKQGVQEVLKAIPAIVKHIPDFNFLIIGGGEYEHKLKLLSKDLKIEKYVTFTGWVKDRDQIDRLLSQSACAVAVYKPEKEQLYNFTYYADPTKLKDYLAAGLPVILTDVSFNAQEIAKKGCGFVVKYDSKEIALAIISLLSDSKKLATYRENAFTYAKTFDWNSIFSQAYHE